MKSRRKEQRRECIFLHWNTFTVSQNIYSENKILLFIAILWLSLLFTRSQVHFNIMVVCWPLQYLNLDVYTNKQIQKKLETLHYKSNQNPLGRDFKALNHGVSSSSHHLHQQHMIFYFFLFYIYIYIESLL